MALSLNRFFSAPPTPPPLKPNGQKCAPKKKIQIKKRLL